MSMNNIIVSEDSLKSDKKYDIITSNSQYVKKFFKLHISEDKIPRDALKSFYVNYYHAYIYHHGFSKFIKKFSNKPRVLYFISSGLKSLKCTKHLALFEQIFFKENEHLNYSILDNEFNEIQKIENLLYINHQWLVQHPNLITIKKDAIDEYFQENLENYEKELRHIAIIKQLCSFVNEDFIEVTAGDANNIYNKSWYFKTVQGYYYMIEQKNIVTMYNSYTKKEVINAKIIDTQAKKPKILNVVSKIFRKDSSETDFYPIQLSFYENN